MTTTRDANSHPGSHMDLCGEQTKDSAEANRHAALVCAWFCFIGALVHVVYRRNAIKRKLEKERCIHSEKDDDNRNWIWVKDSKLLLNTDIKGIDGKGNYEMCFFKV